VSSRRKNVDGVYEDTPTAYHDAVVWGSLAENAAESLRKGDRVLLHGNSYDEEWTDREGHTRTKHVIQVDSLGASLRYTTARLTRTNRRGDQPSDHASEQPAELG
jgi:single-strand DNA-binding protein